MKVKTLTSFLISTCLHFDEHYYLIVFVENCTAVVFIVRSLLVDAFESVLAERWYKV